MCFARGKYVKGVSRFVVGLILATYDPSLSQSLLPDTGAMAVAQRALDLKSNLRVLTIALKPGHEDLATLAYLRFSRGARIMSAYVTNGEAGEHDIEEQYPYVLAVTRRQEAFAALSLLDGEVFFLNMSDVAAAKDSHKIRSSWPPDTLQAKLARVILEFRPHVVLVARDWEQKGSGLMHSFLIKNLLSTIKKVETSTLYPFPSSPGWKVERILVDDPNKRGIRPPLTKDVLFGKTYHEMGEQAARSYHSLRYQWKKWRSTAIPSYSILLNRLPTRIASFDEALSARSAPPLATLQRSIQRLADKVLRAKPHPAPSIVRSVTGLLDSVENRLQRAYALGQQAVMMLLDWKSSLENLRNAMLGVSVSYSVSETVLTDRQLTVLRIDNLTGTNGEGRTEIYFPEKGWIVNESDTRRFPLNLGESYRLISPSPLEYNVPREQYGLQRHRHTHPLNFFLLHKSGSRERSFTLRVTLHFDYAPRFTAEVLTPIVRVFNGERVVVRLTNHSRDGVADVLAVGDSIATSQQSFFRLPTKEAFHLDTLHLSWQSDLLSGEYVVPVSIGGIPVARFVGRKFDAAVDSSKRIGVWSGLAHSEVNEALRRLGLRAMILMEMHLDTLDRVPIDVLILDRRALSLSPNLAAQKSQIDKFVHNGGHLLVLAQDADTWNAHPLIDGLQLTPDFSLDEETAVTVDRSNAIISAPNKIDPEDFKGWVFALGYHRLSGPSLSYAEAPLWATKARSPLLIGVVEGKGRKTYVDLALPWQWMSLHPAAFRLLANLISRKPVE